MYLTRKAGEGRWGTDELAFNEVLAQRNYRQLRATFEAYQTVSNPGPGKAFAPEQSPKLFLQEATVWDMQLVAGWRVLFYNCGSQSGVILPPKGYLIMSGNIWDCPAVCYWHLVRQGQDAVKHLTIHRRVPATRSHSAARAVSGLGDTAS